VTKKEILASELHSAFCRQNHTDYCGWYCETKDGTDDWSMWSHEQYLGYAEKLLTQFSDIDFSQLVELVRFLGKL
jgi:hypothetical protein